jgi:plasmid stabilization system protein ParE
MPTVTFLAGADRDVFEIFARIETRNPEAADTFLRSVADSVRQLGEHPDSGPVFVAPFRRLLMRGYPFGIFYSVEGERLYVQAVLDLRQSPEAIRRRLKIES